MNYNKRIEELTDFQTSFSSTYNTRATILNEQETDLRIELFNEECEELLTNLRVKDKVEIFDAIGDCAFLTFGDIVCFGVQDRIDADLIKETKEKIALSSNIVHSKTFNEYKYSLYLLTYEMLADTISLYGVQEYYSNIINELNLSDDMECSDSVNAINDFGETIARILIKRIAIIEIIAENCIVPPYQNILDEICETVYNSNMSKLDDNKKPIINGENGILDETKPLGKILKSEKFFTPTAKLTELADKYFSLW